MIQIVSSFLLHFSMIVDLSQVEKPAESKNKKKRTGEDIRAVDDETGFEMSGLATKKKKQRIPKPGKKKVWKNAFTGELMRDEASSSENEESSYKPSSRKPDRMDPGNKTKCPECSKLFGKAGNVRRHLIKVHNMDKKQISEYDIATTQLRCKWCKEFFSNRGLHYQGKRCKEKMKALSKKKEATPDGKRLPNKCPAAFRPGGKMILETITALKLFSLENFRTYNISP